MKKLSLVLEGGGMRGAYTAGCLSWLIDENIEFEGAYGISTGAVHLTSFLMKDKDLLFETSTRCIADKSVVGLIPLLKEGQLVSYDRLFDDILSKQLSFDITKVDSKTKAKFGLYDLELGKTVYIPLTKMNNKLLKAACSLPIIGKIIKENNKEYLDGGITEMIPIKEAINDGYDHHLIITTKPIDYVRKPAHPFVVWLMGMVYKKCPNIRTDYRDRHLNYNDQIKMINDLVDEGKAFYRYPSKTINVSRLRGDQKDLEALFALGRQDMENSREAIYQLLND